jgi:predicted transcriptional regulator
MEEELGSIRALSKRIFGAQYRLEILAKIRPDESFHLTELSQQLGTPPSMSSVQKELKVFLEAGLLEEQSSTGMREVLYRALPSPLWLSARQMVRERRQVVSRSTHQKRA